MTEPRDSEPVRFCLVACLLALLASCGGSPSVPTEEPDVLGSWSNLSSSWRWSESYVYAPLSRTAGCDGVLEITSQAGASFEGRYAIDCPDSGRSSGAVVDGHVSPSGELSFRLGVEDGWAPGIPPAWVYSSCRLSSDSEAYQGSIVGGVIEARRLQVLDCPPGGVRVSASFQGDRR
jgi:hypothetical protein